MQRGIVQRWRRVAAAVRDPLRCRRPTHLRLLHHRPFLNEAPKAAPATKPAADEHVYAAWIAGAFALIAAASLLNGSSELTEDQSTAKARADLQPSDVEGSSLKRVRQTNRLSLDTLEANGVRHAKLGGISWIEANGDHYQQPYWNDEAAYRMSTADAIALRNATYELHAMCLEAVALVVQSDALLDVFEIPVNLRSAVRASWKRRDPDLLGRFDFSWDGREPPKLLEYNADTPTVLVETGVGQRLWAAEVLDSSPLWCFNEIEERLQAAWPKIARNAAVVHLAGTHATDEEKEQLAFMHVNALRAGLCAKQVAVANLQVDEAGHLINALQPDEPIECLWKLYPYEWLAEEDLGLQLWPEDAPGLAPHTRWIEPAWKLILGNKALVALLWELYPGHPNLLPASYDSDDVLRGALAGIPVVAKPKFGREGNGIIYSEAFATPDEFIAAADGASTLKTHDNQHHLELGRPVYQAYHATSAFHGRKIVVGSWVIHGAPSGFCFREDNAKTTNDNSCFVPHCISGPRMRDEPLPALTPLQKTLMKSLYGSEHQRRTNAEHSSAYSSVRNVGGGYTGGVSSAGTGGGGGGFYGWFRGSQPSSTGASSSTASNPQSAADAKAAEYTKTQRPRSRPGRTSVGRTGSTGTRVTASS
ncbi:hypothetical protein ACHHYP_10555 [Achlya hypogyna]|uniref:Glutathionylspermidine synthase pre-ATP-grasp-like domain-containing protein n=1 Tax=Achlya hypogyna TaxID=1202772 RepID=A0A1V9YL40_ACHHY|nr:hypothetical protein ACHHYP_10555 [Achlya hypogyna]